MIPNRIFFRGPIVSALLGLVFSTVLILGRAYGDPPTYSTGAKRLIFQSLSEYNAAKPLGDGLQQKTGMAQCREQPNIIYLGQDGASPSVSLDGGVTWYLPHWVGMESHLTQGLMCDPLDPSRVAVVTNEVYPGQTGKAGLYVSFDGGQTAVRKVVWNPTLADVHPASQGIGFSPASEANGKANRWIFIGAAESGSFPIYESSDGMTTFNARGTIPYATYGLVKHVIGLPTNNNRYLVAFSEGLYWLENAHTGTLSLQPISGTGGGLPAGAVNGPPYVSDDGQTIIVGVAGNGVWKSTNGGSSWNLVATQSGLNKLFVNRMNPSYMAITRTGSDAAGYPLFSQNGTTFNAPLTMENRPGFTGTLSPGYQHNHVAWINGSGELWFAGQQKAYGSSNSDYRSSDGGQNLTLSMQGMNGIQMGGLLDGTQVFDPVDKNRIGFPAIDANWNVTADGFKSIDRNVVPGTVIVSGTHTTVIGAILHPTLNRAVIGMDAAPKGYLYVYDGTTWSHPAAGVYDRYHGLCYNPDTLVAFGGELRSTDWINWSATKGPGTNFKTVGATHSDSRGQAIFAVDDGASPKSHNLKRTTNDGTSWNVVLTASYSLMGGAGYAMGPFAAHPSNRDIVYTKDSTGKKLRKWDLITGTVSADFDPTSGSMVNFDLAGIAIDGRNPNVIYVRNAFHGTGYKLLRTTDGGTTWTNLSTLVPDGQANFMAVHPLTGELIYTCASGSFILAPPYTQSGKIGDNMFTAGNMLQDNYLTPGIFTASEDIGAPALAGSATLNESSGTYTVKGGGADIYHASDQFRFLHQNWTGDGRIVARVTSQTTPATNDFAKAGLMFRDNTAAGSRQVDLIIAPVPSVGGAIQMQQRATVNGTTTDLQRNDNRGMPYWLRLERHGNQFTGWESLDGLTWLVTNTTTLALNSSLRAGLAVTAHDNTKLNTATFTNVSVSKPPVWTGVDVGSVGSAGSTAINYATDTFTVNGAGTDIFGAADSFHFCYLPWTGGDATIIAEVSSVENTSQFAKGGLMIRQNLTNNSAHAMIDLKPAAGSSSGAEFIRRPTSGGAGAQSTGSPVGGMAPPRFLKLVRSGNSFSAYQSADSITWTQVGSTETIAMTGTVYIGLASCSIINTSNVCTSTFQSVFVK